MNDAKRYIADVYQWVINDHNKIANYPEDLIQHVFCIICEESDEFIISLGSTNKLKAYACKILYNTNKWQRTPYSKQQAEKEIPTESFKDIADDIYNEIEIPIEKVYWFKAEILKLYAELGTYRAVSEKTGIPLVTVFKAVTEARNEIKKLI